MPPVLANASFAGHRTARSAVELLVKADPRFRCPSAAERAALLIGFAMRGKALVGAAFDAVRLDEQLDLLDPAAIATSLDAVTICEIKSTKQEKIGADLKGYLFNITAAEQLTAQALGKRYCFVFVNTISGGYQEMSLKEIYARARGMYAATHVRF